MVTTAADPIFIDTNILLFAAIPASPQHAAALAALHAIAQSGAPAWISRQIVREFLVYLSRPGVLKAPLAPSRAAVQAASLMSIYRVADEDASVATTLLNLLRTIGAAGKQIHDANIVATMQVHGIPRLLTHNVSDFKRYSPLITVVPLQP